MSEYERNARGLKVSLLLGKEFVTEFLEATGGPELFEKAVHIPTQGIVIAAEPHCPGLLSKRSEEGSRRVPVSDVVPVDREGVVEEGIGEALGHLQDGGRLLVENEEAGLVQ